MITNHYPRLYFRKYEL